jgi:lipopolysaccharide heptosyltransferase II
MNILQIIPRLELGGVERGVIDLALYLKQQGHKPVVISSGGRLVQVLEDNGIAHYALPVHLKSLFTAWQCVKHVREVILREKIDIVHCRSRVPDIIGYWSALKTSARFIITAHGCYSVNLFSRVVRLSRLLIVPGNQAARYFIERFAVDPERIRVIPRGLDLKDFAFNPSADPLNQRHAIAFVGRISPVKGIEYLIDAMNDLIKKYPHLICYIAGAPGKKHQAYKEYLESMVRRHGLGESVVFCGIMNTAELLDKVSVMVLPSVVPETFGRVLIEAAAKGVPCVATDLGGPREIITHGDNGMLVPAFDAAGIAEAVDTLLSDREQYDAIVRNARRQVEEKYRLDTMCQRTLEVYSELLECREIVVFKLSALGDVVLATAAFKSLKERFPGCRLSVVVSRDYAPVIAGHPCVDRVIAWDAGLPRWKELLRLSSLLRREQFDAAVDLQNSRFTHLLAALSCPKKTIGVDRKYGKLLDERVDYESVRGLSPLESQRTIMASLGIENMARPSLIPDDSLRLRLKKQVESCLGNRPLVVINMGASAGWKTKTPSLQIIAETAGQCIRRYGAGVVLIGTDVHVRAGSAVAASLPEDVLDLCGKTGISEMIALISLAAVLITPDSAPLHIATALGVPSLAFFGPTSPARHVDPDSNVRVVSRELACRGCYKKDCPRKDCMKFTVEEIQEHLDAVLA